MSAASQTTLSADYIDDVRETDILEEVAARKIREFAPVIGYVAIVVLCGFCGNVVTFVYYVFKLQRTNTNVFIASLAVTDALTCLVTSDEIIELCYAVTFSSSLGCRFMYFLNHSCVVASILTLFLIGIDRFRKICYPFSWQISMRTTKRCIPGVIIFAVLFSVRDFVILDIVRVPIENGTASAFYCTHSNDIHLEPVVTAFQMIDAIVLLSTISILIVMYSKIVRQIFVKHKKATKQELTPEPGDVSNGGGTEIGSSSREQFSGNTPLTVEKGNSDSKPSTSQLHSTSAPSSDIMSDPLTWCPSSQHTQETSFSVSGFGQGGHQPHSHCHAYPKLRNDRTARKTKRSNRKLQNRMQKQKEARIERQITLMMLAISVAFIISFVPYFVVNLAVKLTSKTNESELSAGIQLALRSYVLNSAVNPYIICLFNSGYRRFILGNVQRCFHST